MYNDKTITVIIAAAGSGRRMGGINKQYIELCGIPVLARSAMAFQNNRYVDHIVIVVKAGEEERCRREIIEKYGITKASGASAVTAGGKERQDSVMAALTAVPEGTTHVLVHDGARPLVSEQIINDITALCIEKGAAVPAVPVKDTIKSVSRAINGEMHEAVECTPDRSTLRAVQTPQGFEYSLLMDACRSLSPDTLVTDDASIVEAYGYTVYIAEGDENNFKITTPSDTERAERVIADIEYCTGGSAAESDALMPESCGSAAEADSVTAEQSISSTGGSRIKYSERSAAETEAGMACIPRTGIGYDVHAFAEDRKLILGGVEIAHEKGLLGHSDADVLIHAVMDALLGAAALGDIGKHFPDTDEKYRGISSLKLLGHVGGLLAEEGWQIVNIDVVVIAQRPKIAPHITAMKKNMAEVLKISESQINIKGTTTERLGFTGREEGIASQAAAVIIQI